MRTSNKRITLASVEAQHPTADCYQIKNSQLFLVAYPGMTLAVSFDLLIGFSLHGVWHLTTEKINRATDKHRRYLAELFWIRRWYPARKNLLRELHDLLDFSECV